MARSTNNKGALTVMIIILIILGLSAAGIGYYLYTIQDVTPQESSAKVLETSDLCLDIIALQESSTIIDSRYIGPADTIDNDRTEPLDITDDRYIGPADTTEGSITSSDADSGSTSQSDETESEWISKEGTTGDFILTYDIIEEGAKQEIDLSHSKETIFITIFDQLLQTDNGARYTDTTYTINGIEKTVPIISYDSLDDDQRIAILAYYEAKGIKLADLSQRKFAVHSTTGTDTTINVVAKGEIDSFGSTATASCGALFTSTSKAIPGTTGGPAMIDEHGCIASGILPELWCENVQQCVQIEDVGLCPDTPPTDTHECDTSAEFWCEPTLQCIPNQTICPLPPEMACPRGEIMCDDSNTCVTDIGLCPESVTSACATDTQECSDGSTVTRDPSNDCEFRSCPLAGGAVCGNSIIEDGEECDDGNTVAEDGCSTTCQLEADTSTTSNVTVTIAGSTTCVERVSPGDTVSFTISITNNDTDTEDITKIVNKLPLGFTYTLGSALLNGTSQEAFDEILTITETGSTQELTWDPAPGEDWTLLAGQTMTLRLTAIAGDAALTGGNQNEAVVTPLNTPVDASALRATYVITVAQTCTNPVTGIFDSMIGRIMASMMLIVTAVVFYKSNSSQRVSEQILSSKSATQINNVTTKTKRSFRLFGLKLTHPRKFFEEKFEKDNKK